MQLGLVGPGRMGGNTRERDGGNSRFSDDAPRAERLGRAGTDHLDVGVSGGHPVRKR